MLDENLDIEYDGGGHWIGVYKGDVSEEEFDKLEFQRDKIFKTYGFNIMHISSREDGLPEDHILLDMLRYTRDYFRDYPDHSWIRFDIDHGLVYNAENKDGVIYNYGNIRWI